MNSTSSLCQALWEGGQSLVNRGGYGCCYADGEER
jgi:hypothetical protein